MPPPFFTPLRVLRCLIWFLFGIAASFCAARVLRSAGVFSGSAHFPLNVFSPRPQSVNLWVAALAVWLAGLSTLAYLSKMRRPLWVICFAGFLLISAANGLQGVGPRRDLSRGFAYPISGKTGANGLQYYHDAQKLPDSPAAFLRTFNQTQPTLGEHARTHPPGAVLFFAALTRVTGDRPVFIGLLIAAFSAFVSAGAIIVLVKSVFPGDLDAPANAALLLLCVPAAQIYFCASLDGVIAALLLAGVALACQNGKMAWFLTVLCVGAASFLTFGAVWVVPVLATLAWRRKTRLSFAAAFGGLALAYGLLYAVSGFNYLAALQTASHLENPHGFRLFADPLGYAMTRWEDIAEIIVFAGPFLLTVGADALRGNGFRKNAGDGFWLFAAAVFTLAALFVLGAYRTGETARACLFVYPFLLLPVIYALQNRPRDTQILRYLLWTQTVLMQVIGDYFW